MQVCMKKGSCCLSMILFVCSYDTSLLKLRRHFPLCILNCGVWHLKCRKRGTRIRLTQLGSLHPREDWGIVCPHQDHWDLKHPCLLSLVARVYLQLLTNHYSPWVSHKKSNTDLFKVPSSQKLDSWPTTDLQQSGSSSSSSPSALSPAQFYAHRDHMFGGSLSKLDRMRGHQESLVMEVFDEAEEYEETGENFIFNRLMG